MSVIPFPAHRTRSAGARPAPAAGTDAADAAPAPLRLRRVLRHLHDERGAATAEYAIVIMAAVALASVLVMVVQSDAVRQIIENLVLNAFQGG